MSRDAPEEKLTRLGCRCKMGEGEEDGGEYWTPADLSTHADALAMLTLHLESHRIRGAPEDRPRATKAQKAEVPKLNMNRTKQWERWKSNWLMYKRYSILEDHHDCVFNLWACFSHDLDIAAAAAGLDNRDLTEEQILFQVKRLAVKSTNTLVFQIQFFQMGQDRGDIAINCLAQAVEKTQAMQRRVSPTSWSGGY